MKPRKLDYLLAVAFIVFVAAPALAGPYDPVYKGGPNSVHVAFDFNAFDTPWTPSELSTGPTSFALSDQGPSSIESEADVAFIVPNLIDELSMKHMRLQFFFGSAIDFNLLDVSVVGHDPLGAITSEIGRGGDHVQHVYYIDFDIQPNPDWEEILFNGDPAGDIAPGNFLRLEVDTVSVGVPEPSSIALALLALVGVGSVRLLRTPKVPRRAD